jgi:DNA-binding MarR family transcriptional regulator
MANNRCTYQQQYNVSIPRNMIAEIAGDDDLSRKDVRVILMLFTHLDGYSEPINVRSNCPDPYNYKSVDIENIAETLCMKKKDVKESIKRLEKIGYIEKGSNNSVKGGYRFTF